jgi:hypothetical protein
VGSVIEIWEVGELWFGSRIEGFVGREHGKTRHGVHNRSLLLLGFYTFNLAPLVYFQARGEVMSDGHSLLKL